MKKKIKGNISFDKWLGTNSMIINSATESQNKYNQKLLGHKRSKKKKGQSTET